MYRTVQDVTGSDRLVNSEIASIIAAQFSLQTTLHGVAQASVDHVVRQHHSAYESAPDFRSRQRFRAHDDITLVVRSVNFSCAGSVTSPLLAGLPRIMAPLSITIPAAGQLADDSPPRPFFPQPPPTDRQMTHSNQVEAAQVRCAFVDDAPDTESSSSSSLYEGSDGSIAVNLRAAAAMKVNTFCCCPNQWR